MGYSLQTSIHLIQHPASAGNQHLVHGDRTPTMYLASYEVLYQSGKVSS